MKKNINCNLANRRCVNHLLTVSLFLLLFPISSCWQSTSIEPVSSDKDVVLPVTFDNYPWLKQYKSAEYIGDGCFVFEDKKILNSKGEKIISLDKDQNYFHFHNGKIIVLDDNEDWNIWKIMVYDTNGKEQIPKGYFVEWYSYYEDGEPLLSEGVVVIKDGKYGLLNETGMAIPCIYDSIYSNSDSQILAKKDGEWMVVDVEGKTKPIYQKYNQIWIFSFDTGIACVTSEDDESSECKEGIVNLYNGKVVVPSEYNWIMIMSEKKALGKKDGQIFLVDITNGSKVAIPYDDVQYQGGFYRVIKGSFSYGETATVGLMDANGKEVIPLSAGYSNLIYVEQSKSAMVEKNEKRGVVGLDGKVMVPIIYDFLADATEPDTWDVLFCNGLARVLKNGNYGYVDLKGKEVVPCKYNNAQNFFCGYAAVEKDGLWGFIDTKGKEITPFLFVDVDFPNYYRGYDIDIGEGVRNVELIQGFDEDGRVKSIPGIVDCTGNYTFTEEEIKVAEKQVQKMRKNKSENIIVW